MAEHPYTAWQFWSEQASSAASCPWPVAGAYPSEVAAASAAQPLQPRIEYLCKWNGLTYADCSWEAEGGINSMTQRVPLANARLFHNAAHSIHNTVRSERMLMLNHDSGEGACSERSKRALP